MFSERNHTINVCQFNDKSFQKLSVKHDGVRIFLEGIHKGLRAKSLINSLLYIAILRQGRILGLVKRRYFTNKKQKASQRAYFVPWSCVFLVAYTGVTYPRLAGFSEGRQIAPPIRQSSKLSTEELEQTAQREDGLRVFTQQEKGARAGSPLPTDIRVHIHIQTCIHTHIHTSIYTYIHINIQIYTQTSLRTYIKQISASTYCLPAAVRSLQTHRQTGQRGSLLLQRNIQDSRNRNNKTHE